MSTFTPKPVEFKFGEYFNKGFELFKKDMGTFILAFIRSEEHTSELQSQR